MKAPKEIVELVEKYEKLNTEYEKLNEEANRCIEKFNAERKTIGKELDKCRYTFIEWIGETGVNVGDLFITDKPEGDEQLSDGEYCNQICYGEDWYSGTYYHQIEDSDKYVAYTYEC